MCSQRSVEARGFARRAAVRSFRADRTRARDVWDARPLLPRAARPHAEPTSRICPTRGRRNVTNVTPVHGGERGRAAERTRGRTERAATAREYGESRVCVGEVCQGCTWNHLAVSFVHGTADPPGPSL
ncbi:hypothetical protein DI270_012600 [Microbispora triticiradicis]|uniref:Uncharacterized protein n=1 Tax=Microbispora triticiradicis TaxID=2200763 RepID=A0ABX9LLQ9_9ACTN|nr:DUF5318 family protein [Microbispora triticiradicis]RGA04546.1 hypothetical protein DI270_012600 [Microbispora triticiradicis]